MKCIQSIKQTKEIEIGTIKRLNDNDAESNVKSGYWKYVPKSEWKKSFVVKTPEPLSAQKNNPKKNKK